MTPLDRIAVTGAPGWDPMAAKQRQPQKVRQVCCSIAVGSACSQILLYDATHSQPGKQHLTRRCACGCVYVLFGALRQSFLLAVQWSRVISFEALLQARRALQEKKTRRKRGKQCFCLLELGLIGDHPTKNSVQEDKQSLLLTSGHRAAVSVLTYDPRCLAQ